MTRRTFLIAPLQVPHPLYVEPRFTIPPEVNTYVRCWHAVWIVRATAQYEGETESLSGYYVHLEGVNEHRIPFPGPNAIVELPIPLRECELKELIRAMPGDNSVGRSEAKPA